jgi:CMP-N,N'-diacetyllegionaminic acid synthase
MKIICIILARKGSLRIPNKNLLSFKNYPLVHWTLKQSLRIRCITKIILSTDCPSIIKISKSISNNIIINKRTKKLSGSRTKSETVIKHLKKKYNLDESSRILILQPTSPLRTDKDINKTITLANKYNLETLHSGNIYKKKIKINKKINLFNDKKKMISDISKKYSYNGAIYFFNLKYFIDTKSIYEKNPNLYKMKNKNSLDIDTYFDLKGYKYKVYKN